MIGGVRFGSNAEGEGVHELPGMMVITRGKEGMNRMERGTLGGHSRTANASLPSIPCTYISSTTTATRTGRPTKFASLRSSTHAKYLKASQQPAEMVLPLQPPIQLISPI